VAEPGEEEDRVVGHDSEEEHEHDRLDLARHGDAEQAADCAEKADGDDERDADGEQGEKRSDEGSVGEADDESDEDDRRRLDEREGLLDQPPLLDARRHHAGDADECVLLAEATVGEPAGETVPGLESQIGLEVEVGDRGGGDLPRARDGAGRAQEREREGDGEEVRVPAAGDRDRALDDAGLRAR
jgi:hypothetical protein